MTNETQIPDGAREVARKELAEDRQRDSYDMAATDMNGQPEGHFVHAYAEEQVKELREQLTRWREDAERLAGVCEHIGYTSVGEGIIITRAQKALTTHAALINETNKTQTT